MSIYKFDVSYKFRKYLNVILMGVYFCSFFSSWKKNGFVTATRFGTSKFFVAATKNFAAATKRFVDRTKHFVVVTK